MKQIRSGEKVIEAQLNAGYESSRKFTDAFLKIMEAPPKNFNNQYNILKSSWLDSPLGPILAISDNQELYLLEFIERRGLEREVEQLRDKTKSVIIPGRTNIIDSIEKELNLYFSGKLREFKTPIHLIGSDFQKTVWQELMRIPYGETRSYLVQAKSIGKPTAFRAVANANGSNQFAIIVPCHRVINTNGKLGGYGGGISRKQWLIDMEKQN
jgi:AraC family transcriptional regulator of adaptative response/methylated-DNA-[protein]-cysteine methyltransferase